MALPRHDIAERLTIRLMNGTTISGLRTWNGAIWRYYEQRQSVPDGWRRLPYSTIEDFDVIDTSEVAK